MFKKFFCIIATIAMVFCLSCGNIAGVVAVADDYLEVPSKGGTLVSGTYKLTENVFVSNQLQVTTNVEATIDLNGCTLSSNATNVIVVNGGTLNLIDSSDAGTGCVKNTSTITTSYGITLTESGTVNMYGGTVSGSYGIYSTASTDCTINIFGGTIEATNRVAVYNNKGSITISGTDKVVISALSQSGTDAYGIRSISASITISNPNTYVSSKSTSALRKNLTSNTKITAGHYSSDVKNYINTTGYSCKESGDADYPYVVTADVSPDFYGRSLTMDGEVGVTYYFSMEGVTNPADYVLKTSLGDVVASDEKKTIEGVEYYRYIVYVSPTQFDTTITAYLTDGATKVSVSDYSVYAYCAVAITSDESDELHTVRDLCEAVLIYGYYAEIYAGEENSTLPDNLTAILGSDWLATNDVATWDNPEIAVISSDPDVTKYLALDSNGIYVIFEVTDTASTYTVDGETLEVKYDNGTYYIEYRVPAKEMSKEFTIFRNGEVYTTYSVYTYVKHIIDTGVSAEYNITEDAINLCKAIYNYGEAASNFTGWR